MELAKQVNTWQLVFVRKSQRHLRWRAWILLRPHHQTFERLVRARHFTQLLHIEQTFQKG